MYQVEEPREKQNGEELEKVMIALKELKIMSKCQGRHRKARSREKILRQNHMKNGSFYRYQIRRLKSMMI